MQMSPDHLSVHIIKISQMKWTKEYFVFWWLGVLWKCAQTHVKLPKLVFSCVESNLKPCLKLSVDPGEHKNWCQPLLLHQVLPPCTLQVFGNVKLPCMSACWVTAKTFWLGIGLEQMGGVTENKVVDQHPLPSLTKELFSQHQILPVSLPKACNIVVALGYCKGVMKSICKVPSVGDEVACFLQLTHEWAFPGSWSGHCLSLKFLLSAWLIYLHYLLFSMSCMMNLCVSMCLPILRLYYGLLLLLLHDAVNANAVATLQWKDPAILQYLKKLQENCIFSLVCKACHLGSALHEWGNCIGRLHLCQKPCNFSCNFPNLEGYTTSPLDIWIASTIGYLGCIEGFPLLPVPSIPLPTGTEKCSNKT